MTYTLFIDNNTVSKNKKVGEIILNEQYLGSLKSDFENYESIDKKFIMQEIFFTQIRSLYVAKRISEEEAAKWFKVLTLKSLDGSEWMLGPTTGIWYKRRDGNGWLSSNPPFGVTVDINCLPGWINDGIVVTLIDVSQDSKFCILDEQIISNEEVEKMDISKRGSKYKNGGTSTYLEPSQLDWLLKEWDSKGEDSETIDKIAINLQVSNLYLSDETKESADIGSKIENLEEYYDLS